MLAAKLKYVKVLDLFRKHGGRPPEPSNSTSLQHGSHSGEGSRKARSSSESDDGSDVESTTSTDARDGMEDPDDSPRWRDSDPYLTQNRPRRGLNIRTAGPHRSHRRTSRMNNDRRTEYQEYPRPAILSPTPSLLAHSARISSTTTCPGICIFICSTSTTPALAKSFHPDAVRIPTTSRLPISNWSRKLPTAFKT